MISRQKSSLREGFFSRRSNLTTMGYSDRCKIASYLAMTSIFLCPSMVELRILQIHWRFKIGRFLPLLTVE